MATAWNVKVREGQLVIGGPWMPRPFREPDFGPTEFDVQATSWVDDIQRHFLPVIEADPRITIYVEVGTERDKWGIMHAWLVSRSVAAQYAAVNNGVSENIDPLLTVSAEGRVP